MTAMAPMSSTIASARRDYRARGEIRLPRSATTPSPNAMSVAMGTAGLDHEQDPRQLVVDERQDWRDHRIANVSFRQTCPMRQLFEDQQVVLLVVLLLA